MMMMGGLNPSQDMMYGGQNQHNFMMAPTPP